MGKVVAEFSMSLDGFVAGPNAGPHNGLGDGGLRIHQWMFDVKSWRERHSLISGPTNQDDEVVKEYFARTGAYVMGRRMFDEGEVAWPNPPPFQAPVFVLTNHAREPWVRQGGTTFTFVPDGIESTLEKAKSAADDKDVMVAGGANTIQQFLEAGFVDEVQIHLVPVLLGDGARLFDHLSSEQIALETTRVIDAPGVTHLKFRVTKENL
ncbi:MAG: dihydrofolate reductase family protein [Rubrobacteraceae bacterium]